jgi:hypothetical protein
MAGFRPRRGWRGWRAWWTRDFEGWSFHGVVGGILRWQEVCGVLGRPTEPGLSFLGLFAALLAASWTVGWECRAGGSWETWSGMS